jgi:hypothetical protein
MDQQRNQSQREREQTRGQGSQGERNRGEGISNRGLDCELEEQNELPERGSSQTDRDSDHESER